MEISIMSKKSLAELIAEGRKARVEQEAVLQPTTPPARDILYGTGFTKKVAEKRQFTITAPSKQLDAAEKYIQEKAAEEAIAKQPPVLNLPVVDDSSITLDASQRQAVDGIKEQRFSVLIGAAGTGKTTTVKTLINEIQNEIRAVNTKRVWYDEKTKQRQESKIEQTIGICFCAFTGRAVEQLKRAIPEQYHPNAATIHSTLGYYPEFYEEKDDDGFIQTKMKFVPFFTETNKLPYKVYVIDEGGMCPVFLWNELYAAMPDDAKVIIVGDINQLPPVHGKSILGHAMRSWPKYELTTIHRNAGLIVHNAHKVLQGRLDITQAKGEFQLVKIPDNKLDAYEASRKAIMILARDKLFDPAQDAFIVAENGRALGKEEFNSDLAPYFNKDAERVPIDTGMSASMYAIGDKVMILQNVNSEGLTNGMVGHIKTIHINPKYNEKKGHGLMSGHMYDGDALGLSDILTMDFDIPSKQDEDLSQRQASHITTVEFNNGKEILFSTSAAYSMLTHAYAFTCHKSQGGEYPTVVILCHSANSVLLSREWLYTAITRAQKSVYILYNDRGLNQAIKSQRVKGNTLEEKIESFILSEDAKDHNIPNLPVPREM
jgi:exodeoxyribonuclease V alpha subunit